jgi:hypothetical protein
MSQGKSFFDVIDDLRTPRVFPTQPGSTLVDTLQYVIIPPRCQPGRRTAARLLRIALTEPLQSPPLMLPVGPTQRNPRRSPQIWTSLLAVRDANEQQLVFADGNHPNSKVSHRPMRSKAQAPTY